MKILGVIPARYQSTRFPGKPLIDLAGKSMIQRVYEQVLKSDTLNDVVIATDDERIANHVASFNGKFIFTSNIHQSGTDRCAEVAEKMSDFDIIINIQGDEPLINPNQLSLLASCFKDSNVEIATLIKEIKAKEELFNFNIPKVVINKNQEAIYFSRQTLPFLRNVEKDNWLPHTRFFKHIGLYAYKRQTLIDISKLPVSFLENSEMLEQLRWIENGYKIKTATTNLETLAIDSPEDVEKVLKKLTEIS